MQSKRGEDDATRRFAIISPLLEDQLSDGEVAARRRAILAGRMPDGSPVLSARTLRRWLHAYDQFGYDGLRQVHRVDHGRPRALTSAALDIAVALKGEAPFRSVRTILEILEQEGVVAVGSLARATLDRQLRAAGVMTRRKVNLPRGCRRFRKGHRNELWQIDLKYGPYLPDPDKPGKVKKTYLIAIIDDYSRLVPSAQFYFEQKSEQLEDCFKWAVLRYGLPDSVYVDNGKIFVSQVFQTACAQLNIRHRHTAPYAPESKGKIERFMGHCDQFINELHLARPQNLETVNDLFAVWLTEAYQQHPHSEMAQQSPAAVFAACPHPLRYPDADRLHEAFLWEETRKVDKTGCVKLRGTTWEVGPQHAGAQVRLRFDPLLLDEVTVWRQGLRVGLARPLRINPPWEDDPFADPPTPTPISTKSRYLTALQKKGQARRRLTGGIPYTKLREDGHV